MWFSIEREGEEIVDVGIQALIHGIVYIYCKNTNKRQSVTTGTMSSSSISKILEEYPKLRLQSIWMYKADRSR
jgi:hypothetical protein